MITNSIEAAVNCIEQGGIIIFPTETVYGMGASSYNYQACKKIYQIKNRPLDNPLIVHLAHIEQIQEIAYIENFYFDFIQHFSPGPITYILKKKDPLIFSTGFPTIGIRIPNHPIAYNLLKSFGKPVSAPSVNFSGKPSITSFNTAKKFFFNQVDLIFKGENSEIGLESTIIDLSAKIPVYLREGYFSFEELIEFLPQLQKKNSKNPIPGLKYKHYSPNCKIFLVESLPKSTCKNQGRLGYEIHNKKSQDKKISNNIEYMQSLYEYFIFCEQNNIEEIFCQIPFSGKGQNVLIDRINRAAKN